MLNLIKDEVNVKEIVFDSNIVSEVELDTKITSELKEEGTIRELARQIQEMRRDGGLYPKDSIIIYFNTEDKYLKEIILRWQKNLTTNVGAENLEFIGNIKDELLIDRHFEIENKDIWIGLTKAII